MNSSKLSKFLNFLIAGIFLILCCFFIIQYLTHNHIIAIILSLMITTIFLTELLHYNAQIANKYNFKKNELTHKKLCESFLLFSNNNVVNDFFYKVMSKRYNINHFSDNTFIDKSRQLLISICFNKEQINNSDLINIIKQVDKQNINEIIICCIDSNITLTQLPIKISLIAIDDLYSLFKLYNLYPITPSQVTKQKHNKKLFKNIKLTTFFNKKHAKPLLICGIFLYFSSFFVQFKLYYCIFAGILLIFSLLHLVFGNHQQSKSNL